MKNIFILFLFFMCGTQIFAQQEPQYTQFMPIKLVFNPAYGGSDGSASFAVAGRQQWVGLDGSPQSQLATFHLPIGDAQRVGVGGNIRRFTIGPVEEYLTEATYAYRVPFARGTLSMGLSGSLKLMRINFDQLTSTQARELDGAIPADIQSKTLPNFGFGFYYEAPKVYLGFSAPRLLNNNIDFAEDVTIISREVTHLYLMGGLTLGGDPDGLQWLPQILMKYVAGAPFDADVSVTALFKGRYGIGAGYRVGGSKRSGIGESVSLFLSITATEKMQIGLGYDVTLSDFRRYNSGTFEGFVKYVIGGFQNDGKYINPRGTEEFLR